jgi:hypothetical protein
MLRLLLQEINPYRMHGNTVKLAVHRAEQAFQVNFQITLELV